MNTAASFSASMAAELATTASSAPDILTAPLLERAGLWAKLSEGIRGDGIEIRHENSDEASEQLRQCFPPDDTYRIAEPAGVFRHDFRSELIAPPPGFVARVQSAKSIELNFSNGVGGDAGVALELVDVLRRCKKPVYTRITGMAASAHAFVFLAGQRRTMAPGAKFMLHGGRLAVFGSADALRQHAEKLDDLNQRLIDLLVERGCRPADAIRFLSGPDFWLDVQAALAAGLVDEICGVGSL